MQIRDFLAPTDAIIDVRASEKAGLLQDLANRIAPPLDSPSSILASALLKREALGSTGTGDGVAIPHLDFVTHGNRVVESNGVLSEFGSGRGTCSETLARSSSDSLESNTP